MINKKIIYKDIINDFIDISFSIKINNLDKGYKGYMNSDIQTGIYKELYKNSIEDGIMFPLIAKCKSDNIKFKVKADINYSEFISKDLIKPITIKNNRQLYVFDIYAIKKINSPDLRNKLLKFCSDDGKKQFINALFSFILISIKDFADTKIKIDPVIPNPLSPNDFPNPLSPNSIPLFIGKTDNDAHNKTTWSEEHNDCTIRTIPIRKGELK